MTDCVINLNETAIEKKSGDILKFDVTETVVRFESQAILKFQGSFNTRIQLINKTTEKERSFKSFVNYKKRDFPKNQKIKYKRGQILKILIDETQLKLEESTKIKFSIDSTQQPTNPDPRIGTTTSFPKETL